MPAEAVKTEDFSEGFDADFEKARKEANELAKNMDTLRNRALGLVAHVAGLCEATGTSVNQALHKDMQETFDKFDKVHSDFLLRTPCRLGAVTTKEMKETFTKTLADATKKAAAPYKSFADYIKRREGNFL